MNNVQWFHVVFLVIATLLEILASILLKISNGFERLTIGGTAIVAIWVAFYFLSLSIDNGNGFSLPVAYALWGATGILFTSVAGWLLFNQKLNKKGVLGLLLIILGVFILGG